MQILFVAFYYIMRKIEQCQEDNTMRTSILFALTLVPFLSAAAHHSRAPFQLNETIEVKGTVTDVGWRTPHVYLELESAASGEPEIWTFEGHAIAGMIRNGWLKDSVQVGDRVVIVANPNRKLDTKFGLLNNVTLEGGSTFYAFRRPQGVAANLQVSQAPVSASTDFSGTWRVARTRGGANRNPNRQQALDSPAFGLAADRVGACAGGCIRSQRGSVARL